MRVLFDRRPALTCGTGIGRYAACVADSLAGEVTGHEVLSLGGDLELRVRSALDEQVALPALLDRLGAQLYHSPLFLLPDVLPCRAVVTLHDAVPAVHPELTTSAFSALFEHADVAAERAAAIVCPSEFARSEVAAALGVGASKIAVVPEAPARVFFTPSAAPDDVRRRLELTGPAMLCVGGYEPRKDQGCLLQALRRLPAAVGVFVGAGTERGELAAEAERLGVADRVRILGRVDDAALNDLYRGVDAVVVPSRHEGFGLPVVEAFAAGTPVLHSTAGALPEVAGDAGLAFEPGHAEGLAAGVQRLLDDDELRQQLVTRGRERLGARYADAHVRAGFKQLYDALSEEGDA